MGFPIHEYEDILVGSFSFKEISLEIELNITNYNSIITERCLYFPSN